MASAVIRIDQYGLPPGVNGRARINGLSTGALVTLTSTDPGGTNKFQFLHVPANDNTAVATLAPTGGGATPVWTFTPTVGAWGPYRIELIVNEGLITEDRQIKIFAIPAPNTGLIPPALGERGDPLATLLNNGVDVIENTERNVTVLDAPSIEGYLPFFRDLTELLESSLGVIGLHKTSHQDGGTDEISVAGLLGLLATAQTPTAHAATHTNGADDIQDATAAVKGLATPTQITKLDGLTKDHGSLDGLSDDGHSQYHNDTRGDARYPLKALMDAKGDLWVGTADNTVAKLTVGADHMIPHANSATPVGMEWRYQQLVNTAGKTSGYTALPFENVLADPTSAAFTVLAPTTPFEGMRFGVTNYSSSWNAIKIDGNGSTFERGSTYRFHKAHGHIEFQYISGKWRVFDSQRAMFGFNVWEYDAIPDGNGAGGGTDNTTAYQACVDVIHSVGGGILYLPAGIYRKDNETIVYSCLHILGEYSGVDPVWNVSGVVIDPTNMPFSNDSRNAVFKQISEGIFDLHLENFVVKGPLRSTITNWYSGGTAALWLINSRALRLHNVSVYGIHYGFYLWNPALFRITHCKIQQTANVGLFLYGDARYGSIVGGDCSNGKKHNIALVGYQSGYEPHDIDISLPMLDECNDTSLYMERSYNISFRSNCVYTGSVGGVGTGVKIAAGCSNINLDGFMVRKWDNGAVPLNTIAIAADANNVILSNIRTEPNGGGDISDLAANTIYHNCLFNGIKYSRNERRYLSQSAEPTALVGETMVFTDTDTGKSYVLYGTAGGNKIIGCDSGSPAAHAASHQDGGSDEISVAGLLGLLATAQNPVNHAASHQNGAGDEISVAGLSGELADAQTPKTHAASHISGDAIQNATASQNGLATSTQIAKLDSITIPSLTDNRMVKADGTVAIQNTGISIDDSDRITEVKTLNYNTLYSNGNSGAAFTMHLNNGQVQSVTLSSDGAVLTIDPTDITGPGIWYLDVASGGANYNWDPNPVISGGLAYVDSGGWNPALSLAQHCLHQIVYDGTNIHVTTTTMTPFG